MCLRLAVIGGIGAGEAGVELPYLFYSIFINAAINYIKYETWKAIEKHRNKDFFSRSAADQNDTGSLNYGDLSLIDPVYLGSAEGLHKTADDVSGSKTRLHY